MELTEAVPVFTFDNPWVWLIQVALAYVLPRLTGLITSKWAASITKTLVLGVLIVVGSALTWLLDVAVANTWATADWTALIAVVVNSGFTWLLAQQLFDRVIKPSGQAERDAESGLHLFEDPQRYDEALEVAVAEQTDTIAARRVAAESVARQVATEVVEEKLAAIPVAKVSTPRKPAAPKAK